MIMRMQIFAISVMTKFRQCVPTARFSTFLILLQMPYKSTERSDLKLIMFVMNGSSNPGSLNEVIKLVQERRFVQLHPKWCSHNSDAVLEVTVILLHQQYNKLQQNFSSFVLGSRIVPRISYPIKVRTQKALFPCYFSEVITALQYPFFFLFVGNTELPSVLILLKVMQLWKLAHMYQSIFNWHVGWINSDLFRSILIINVK